MTYRHYEDPYILEDQLKTAKANLAELDMEKDESAYIELSIYIAELEDRINYAWQDIEYDENEREI